MKLKSATITILTLTLVMSGANAAESIRSLRGAVPIDQEVNADDMKKVQAETAPIQRNYVQQPPLIPHSIRNYTISLNNNKCMDCHSWQNYQDFEATKVSQTHFTDSQGVDLADVSPRRYFCTQCHITQVDAQPLIENDFVKVRALSRY
jgi:cytochrome c-type protein NapB